MLANRMLMSSGSKLDLTGVIAMFNTTTLPTGWVLCDGANGTPDLRDRFVVGAGSSYALGATGGANTVTLTTAELPSHSHNAGTSGNGAHSHSSNSDGAHTHSVSLGNGSHAHSYTGTGSSAVSTNGNTSGPVGQGNNSSSVGSAAEGDNHGTSTSSSSGGHAHSTNSDGGHNHGASANSTGGSGAHENRPPYYSLVYAQGTKTAKLETGIIALTELSSISGWNPCDGLLSTPDLRDRFIVGSQLNYALGATGGANTVTLTTTEMPSHSHSVSIGSGGNHAHNTNTDGSHSHSATVGNHGNHIHSFTAPNVVNTNIGGGNNSLAKIPNTLAATANAASSSHAITHAALTNTHGHNIVNSSGGHSHSVSGGTTGSSGAHENRPPYRAANFLQLASSTGKVPAGLIVMYNGSTAPSGWALCDGLNGTPDYRNYFVVGAGNLYATAALGGSNTVTLTATEMPGHNHNGGTNTDGAHSAHTLASGGVSHSHSNNTGHNTSHLHSATQITDNKYFVLGNWTGTFTTTNSATTGNTSHGHNVSAASGGGHAHTLATNSNHGHNASMGNAGSGSAHENRPPYYALTYIIKI